MKTKHNFNMIEILLALGLTAVGITGLMGIIPLALNANRDAMAETYTADIANSFFAQRCAMAAKNFATVTTLYDSKPSAFEVWFPTNRNTDPTKDAVDLSSDMEITSAGSGIWHVRVGKAGTSLPDFSADLCAWYEWPNDITGYNENASSHKLARLYVEISWPVTAAYAARSKRTYVKEILDTNIPLNEEPGS